jgi:hypothetical protein
MNDISRNDYYAFLDEVGANEADVRAATEKECDRVDIETDSVFLAESDIEGLGIFSSGDRKQGDVIMAALMSGKRTQAGRYSNHSDKPNALMQFIGDDVYLVAMRDVKAGDELTTSYRDTNQLISAKPPYSKDEFRSGILEIERYMKEELPLIDPEINHFFADGMYGREMKLNAGDFVVGKIHKTAHIVVVSKGSGYVLSEFGVARYEAPWTFVSKPGTKRAIRAEEDTVWLTLHATIETDLDKIEKEVIASDYESLGGVL